MGLIRFKKKVQEQLEPVDEIVELMGDHIETYSSFVSWAQEAASASPKPAQLNASLKPVNANNRI